MLTLKV